MTHTFLFEPGIWTASGTFWRGDGEPMEAQSRTEITHRDPSCWLLAGTLKVLGSPPVEFVYAYCIEPPGRHRATMKWTSENATLGKLQGTYSVVGTSIICVFRCHDSGYHGAEHFEQLDTNSYRSAGVLFLEDRTLSSWQMSLQRTSH
jgi:hypothetical protein